MLSESFSSSYKQYKNDTSAFTTWLGRAAAMCGYKAKPKTVISETAPEKTIPAPVKTASRPAPQPAAPVVTAAAPRLKGKARKIAKQAQAQPKPSQSDAAPEFFTPTIKEYVVSTQELIEQIETVSQSKSKVSMPSGIRTLLQRAINARKRCSDWYETAKQDAAVLDNGGHRHFINILQEALSKIGAEPKKESGQRRPATSANAASRHSPVTGLENRFSALEVEDVDESFELSPMEVALATRPSSKKVDSVDVFVLEAEQAFDDAFAIFCFFEDLHHIQDRVGQVWRDCMAGRTTLSMATAITQSAITVVRRAEQDLCARILPDDSAGGCYTALAAKMVVAQTITMGTNPMAGGGVDVSPFDDFIFLPVARVLQKYIKMAALTHKPIIAWPAPIMPIRFNYINEPGKADTSEHKKLQADDVLLTQLLLDSQLPDQARNAVGSNYLKDYPVDQIKPVQEDIFLKTMRPVWMKGEISVTSVVMGQLMLDIHRICEQNLGRIYGKLQYLRNYAADSFEFYIDERTGALGTRTLNWPSSAIPTLKAAYHVLESIKTPTHHLLKVAIAPVAHPGKIYTASNIPAQLQAETGWFQNDDERPPPEIQRAMDQLNFTDFIKPAPANDFIIMHNPLYSGSAMLKLIVEYHAAGIALANHHMSIFITAHLYNALRQLNLLSQPWPLMDRIIELHTKEIFAGDIPKKTNDIADRLSYRLNAHRNQRRHLADEKWKFKEPPIAQALRLMLSDDISDRSRGLAQVEQHAERSSQTAAIARRKESKSLQHQALTPKRYVTGLQTTLSSIFDDLSIDYIRLTKFCVTLLDKFRDMWNVYLESQGDMEGVRFPPAKDGKNSTDASQLIVTYEAFEEAKAVRTLGIYTYRAGDGDDRPLKGSDPNPDEPWRHGMGLSTAAKVFSSMVAKDPSDFKLPLRVPEAALIGDEESMRPQEDPRWKLDSFRSVTSVNELREAISSSTYVLVNFYTDYDRTHQKMAHIFYDLAREHSVKGILTFVRVNADDVREESMKYYKDTSIQTFVCLKEGKQVAVNGKKLVQGMDKQALRAAAVKLGGLAKKRLAETEQQKST